MQLWYLLSPISEFSVRCLQSRDNIEVVDTDNIS